MVQKQMHTTSVMKANSGQRTEQDGLYRRKHNTSVSKAHFGEEPEQDGLYRRKHVHQCEQCTRWCSD